ncbi:hypothetical protein J1N35_037610 [Gossypium stocksii]|uniref:Uncharacterized protein n=1 Tax=Gossypium stocksii TaxID=47602 RepID=A0A9D3UKI1_9ROSI|nr:hypothetical protein J1N35_037610 [Gossypium stocksii]
MLVMPTSVFDKVSSSTASSKKPATKNYQKRPRASDNAATTKESESPQPKWHILKNGLQDIRVPSTIPSLAVVPSVPIESAHTIDSLA